jgi:hypothetical protein
MQVCIVRHTVSTLILSISFRLLDDLSAFVVAIASSVFLKLLFTKERRISRIEGYYRNIGTVIESFQVSYNLFEFAPFVDDVTGTNRYQ